MKRVLAIAMTFLVQVIATIPGYAHDGHKEHVAANPGHPDIHSDGKEEQVEGRLIGHDREMPPVRYWIMHWGSRLSAKERQTVFDWAKNSRSTLRRPLD